MPLWNSIRIEIAQGNLNEEFSANDLRMNPQGNGLFLLGGELYSGNTFPSMLAGYCVDPLSENNIDPTRAQFIRIRRGTYSLYLPGGAFDAANDPVQQDWIGNIPESAQSAIADAVETRESFIRYCDNFIEWLVGSLNEFPDGDHSWRARGNIDNCGLPEGTRWSCSSLFSAFQQFVWPAKVRDAEFAFDGYYMGETVEYLQRVGLELSDAIEKNDGQTTRERALNVLQWGGVASKPNVAAHIKRDMDANQLPTHIRETREHLNQLIVNGIPADYEGFADANGHQIRVDSGTTKIYSLLCSDFIIYDSRVACALGYLVIRWSLAQGVADNADIPSSLRFSYPQGHDFRNTKVFAESHGFRSLFSTISVDSSRICENVRASWLLSEVLRRDSLRSGQRSNFSKIQNSAERLRALEAALFMIGYDISPSTFVPTLERNE